MGETNHIWRCLVDFQRRGGPGGVARSVCRRACDCLVGLLGSTEIKFGHLATPPIVYVQLKRMITLVLFQPAALGLGSRVALMMGGSRSIPSVSLHTLSS